MLEVIMLDLDPEFHEALVKLCFAAALFQRIGLH